MAHGIKELDALPVKMVGDNGSQNVYFVSRDGAQDTITTHLPTAIRRFNELAASYPRVECALEDRQFGVIDSVEPEQDGSTRLVRVSSLNLFLQYGPKERKRQLREEGLI